MPGGAGGKEVGRISIRVVPDTSGFREKLRAELAGIDRDIKIDVDPDMSGFREKVKAQTAGMAAQVKVKPDLDQTAWARVKAALALDRIFAPRIRTGGRYGDGNPFNNATGLAQIGNFGSPANLAALAAIAAPAVGLLSGFLVSLPALAAGLVAPIGAIALGLDGIKKAAEPLGPALDAAKAHISGFFEAGLTPIFERMAAAAPAVIASMDRVAVGVVDLVKAATDAMLSPEGQTAVNSILQNVGRALSEAAPGVQDFTDAILGLTSKGAAHLPELSALFDRWGDKFSTWVDTISADGTLDKAITNLGPVADSLANFVGEMLSLGVEMFADPVQAQGIKDLIDSITILARDTLPGLADSFADLSGILKGIADAVDALDKVQVPGWLTTLSNMLGSDNIPKGGVEFNPDQFKPDPKTMGFLDQLETGEFWQVQWQKVADFTAQVGDAFRSISPTVQGVADTAVAAFKAIPGRLATLGTEISTTFELGLQALPQIVGNKIQQVVATVQGAGSAISGALGAAFEAAKQAVVQKMAEVVQSVATGVGNIVNEFSQLGGKVAAACGNMRTVLIQAGMALLQGLEDGIRQKLVEVLAFAASIAGQIAAVKGPLDEDRVELIPQGQALMEGLQTGIEDGLQGVLARAQQIGSEVAAALNNGIGNTRTGTGALGSAAERAVEQAQSMVGQSYVSGISDCSGAISQVYSAMTGKKTHFTTLADFAKLGFKPGFKEGALNIGVNPQHMAATLPNMVSFESGGPLGGGPKYGPGLGALDPQFTKHWYYDAGGLSAFRTQLADTNALSDELRRSLAELSLERKKLKLQFDSTDSKEEKDRLRGEMDNLDIMRDQLSIQQDQLKLRKLDLEGTDKYGDSLSGNNDLLGQGTNMFQRLGAMGHDLAMANIKQFESDIGISGKGAIPVLAEQGLAWMGQALGNLVSGLFGGGAVSKTEIHVNSLDEALAAKQNQDNKRALQWADR